ncbi:MAG: TraB/GumN family protein [Pseudomonadota bacterium]|nr:TraB/GumN family protein [Pseudomonadota bacterium]
MQTASRFRNTAAFLLATLAAPGAVGQTVPARPSPNSAVTLAPVAVTGVLPGPALWKISKDGHVMWVLGITSPLPKGMQWDSTKVDRLIASSQQVLRPPGMDIGAKIGFWGQLFLAPSMLGLKKLPDGETLQQVLSPGLYSRWLVQKNKYLYGMHGWGADRLRPSFAADKLYRAALSRSDLTDGSVVEKAVYSAADRHKVPVESTSFTLMLKDPRHTAKAFKKAPLNDQQCLSDTIDAIDQHFSQATARANAWATGDLAALSKVLSARQQDGCLSAIGGSAFAKTIGLTDISNKIRQAWIQAAETALAHDAQSVAVLPMSQLMAGDGYLSVLKKDGYTVQPPTP